jgi:hypothetical protein
LIDLNKIWGITIGSTILTNRLKANLPLEFLAQFPGGVDLVYSVIPEIRTLPYPIKDQIREAFGQSLRPIWYTFVGIYAIGLVASLFMRDVPLHNYVDEKRAMHDEEESDVSLKEMKSRA